MFNSNANIKQRHRASQIRLDAKTGDYTAALLAKRYGISLQMVYKILQQTRTKDDTGKVNANHHRTIKRASICGILHELGMPYSEIAKVVGLSESATGSLGLRYQRGQLPKRDVSIRIRLIEPVGKIPVGVYDLVKVADLEAMLVPREASKLPFTTTIKSLIGKVEPYANQNDQTGSQNKEGAKS
ncbi:MAG: hypothetical protein K8T91_26700 [Planctomycetes bacterium]|nr:hypothetical protein [Planctomycetota bacterium]